MSRCGNCGSKNIELKNAEGKSFPYKQYEKVELTVNCELYTCNDCGEILMKPGCAKRLDEALEASITRALG